MSQNGTQGFKGLEVAEIDLGVAQVLDEAVDTSDEDEHHAAVEGYEHDMDRSGLQFCAGDAAVEEAGEENKHQYDN